MQMLGNKTIIRHTYENTKNTLLFDEVIVVTDSDIIFNEIIHNGGYAIMSKHPHESGSDRIAEAATRYLRARETGQGVGVIRRHRQRAESGALGFGDAAGGEAAFGVAHEAEQGSWAGVGLRAGFRRHGGTGVYGLRAGDAPTSRRVAAIDASLRRSEALVRLPHWMFRRETMGDLTTRVASAAIAAAPSPGVPRGAANRRRIPQ